MHLLATFTVSGEDQPRDTTVTVSLKDVGTTTVSLPAEALQKLDADPQ